MDTPHDNNNSNSSSEAPPVRTLIGEIASYSLVTSTAQKVSATHQSLCGRVPLYGRLTGAAIASATTLADHAHSFTIVRVTVTKVDDWGLQALDRLKEACPVLCSSSNQKSEEVREIEVEGEGVRLGELSLVRSACWAIDTVLSSAEIACHTLVFEDDSTWSKLVQKVVPRVLLNPINTALSATGCLLARGRRAVQARCGDAVALKSNIKMRRKVTPRKARGGWLWVWMRRRISGWTHSAVSSLSDPSLSAVAKKRKEPDDGSSTSSDGGVTCSLDAIDGYQSDQDPDYVPSEKSTTDSMEFCSGSDIDSDDEMKVDDHKQSGLTSEGQPESSKIVVTQHYTNNEPMEVAEDIMDGKTDTQRDPQEKAVDEQKQKEVSMATSNNENDFGVSKEKEGSSSETKDQKDGSSEPETGPGEKMETEGGSSEKAEQEAGSTETEEIDNGSGTTQEKENGTGETQVQQKDKVLTQKKMFK